MVMLIVLLIIFVVMFCSFGSIWQMLLVIFNIPSTMVGGILGLLFAGQTVNVSSTIGLIALFGICAQNDIILLARSTTFADRGSVVRDAVIEGAMVKFRPIFITNLVMIVGVLPLVLTVSTGAGRHRPLAGVYIGGFFFAVLLRLFVVPVLYDTFARAAEWFHFTNRPGSRSTLLSTTYPGRRPGEPIASGPTGQTGGSHHLG